MAFADFENVFRTVRHDPDMQAARATLSVIASHRLGGPCCWLMVIAPPGSGKTELLESCQRVPSVHLIDSVTPKTFISGYIDPKNPEEQHGLLARIGTQGILMVPEFSTLLEKRGEDRAIIFADLRRIYDGSLTKTCGVNHGDSDHWEGRITMIAATTPAVDGKMAELSELGDRFLIVRWPRVGVDAAMFAMQRDPQLLEKLERAASALFSGIDDFDPEVSRDQFLQLANLAELVAFLRTPVKRDRSKAVESVSSPESSPRVAIQLQKLVKGSAMLDQRGTVNAEDMAVARRVALDSVNPLRREILSSMLEGRKAIGAPATLCYARDDLYQIGLLEGKHLPQLAVDLLLAGGFEVPAQEQDAA